MKTKNLLGIFGIMFLALALAPLVSASVDAQLFDGSGSANIEGTTLTFNQGNSFSVQTIAFGYGETFNLEELKIGNTIIFTETQPGTNQGWGIYSYGNTKTIYLDSSTYPAGTYSLVFTAKGSQTGQTNSASATLIVNPVDTTDPVITILGTNPITITLGSVYTDAGATALDNLDGVITANIIVVNNVNTAIAGTYSVVYSVSDLAGNSASATRSVIVSATLDITAPTIIISSPVNGQTYTTAVTNITYVPSDANLNKCWYSLNGGVTNSTAISCNNAVSNLFLGLLPVQGSNTWTVWANDTAGNLGSALVTFTINDLIAPTITALVPLNNAILDDTDVTFKVSTNEDAVVKYSINGATNVTMVKTSNFEFWSALLDLDDDKEYTVIYTATDLMGNTASLTLKFKIDENVQDNVVADNTFSAEDLSGITIEPTIDLTDEESKSLNWWQKFINWLARLFGLEEVY